jgi:hypothetical protein
MAKKFDPKAKAKRQKIFAAVGGVILLAVLAYQVPRTLKMLHQSNANASSSPPASTTTASGATGAVGASSLGGGTTTAAAVAAVSSDGVSDPGVLQAPQSGQLLAFSRFRTKDPFAQQLAQAGATGAAGATGTTGATGTKGGGAKTGSSGSGSGGQKPPAPPVAKLTTATITVNGVSEAVQVGAQFPSSNPTFVLVSVTKTSAQIGIAGGSLEGSKHTVTLTKNKPLTLMNTADGTRYVLRLLSVS